MDLLDKFVVLVFLEDMDLVVYLANVLTEEYVMMDLLVLVHVNVL